MFGHGRNDKALRINIYMYETYRPLDEWHPLLKEKNQKSPQLPPFVLISGDGASPASIAPPLWACGRHCSKGTFRRRGDRRRCIRDQQGVYGRFGATGEWRAEPRAHAEGAHGGSAS
ncbi:hypothetical protein CXB51_010975 [Gossypium anomalum]|uniref:Uncharacterized protein n=1 Tax=Gossypium anomalum TaxID=47600 RepID=A0A8J5ZNZ9_9ROSI|nr:hypothetical protein CXB51_010975 [Gossypium anomalum]